MAELSQPRPLAINGFNQNFALWIDRSVRWVSKHWLAVTNTFFLLYVGLPILAPILLAYGFTGPANLIYSLYRAACHQLPSRSYFILGEQVAFCQRDVAIYGMLFLGGVVYGLARPRLQPPALRWYAFFLVPIAVDGGMQLVSQLLEAISVAVLWGIGLVIIGLVTLLLYRRRHLSWHPLLFFTFGPLALIYLQFVDPHYHSDWLRRTLTGSLFALGTVWFAYPYLEESFNDIHQEVSAKLARASAVGKVEAG
ncbi:MAG: DUF2085 domain-containing protein [Chloroflexota bacterium]